MATLISLSIDTKKISKKNLHKGQYLNLTIAINDQVNDYDQNVSAWISQTAEEREADQERQYMANGATIWTDGKTFVPEKKNAAAKAKPKAKKAPAEDDGFLPF
jgi:hypothetical protein